MKALRLIFCLLTVVVVPVKVATTHAVSATPSDKLTGLWSAQRFFSADLRGALSVSREANGWRAEIRGRSIEPRVNGSEIKFSFPAGFGDFIGAFTADRTAIRGFWIQPGLITIGRLASPVTLNRDRTGVWRGEVVPLDDSMICYLMVEPRPDGSLGAFLRNPERNLGWTQYRIDSLEAEGDAVKLLAAGKDGQKGRVLAEGHYDAGNDVLSLYLPNRGGTYDFSRVGPDEASNFYPRGHATVPYTYRPPPALEDGWPVATLEDVGLSREKIEKFIQAVIDTPMDSVSAQEDHGVLIARHGKLVLEEYFHGESRDRIHDTRSASKSIASELMGAAIASGVRVDPADHVYQLMNGGTFPADLDARKRAMTVENILTMSSGFDCDEGNPNTAGFEDNLWSQTDQPDYYRWTMDLKMVRDPGTKGVYCSAGANLVGGVVARAAGRPTRELFPRLLAEPLGIKHYYIPVSPLNDYTLTGGSRFLPRDFMKFGQLHLNGGVWRGRRIYTSAWSAGATNDHVKIGESKYGYLWWVNEYPYQGRTIRAYFAAGNGGQIVMTIPELDLVMAFYGGNYNAAGGRTAQNVYVPKYILPAVLPNAEKPKG